MDRKSKEKLKEEYVGEFAKTNAAVVAEYRGLTVAQLTELRKNLRKVNAEFKVVKNRVAKKAIAGSKSEAMVPSLKGPIGVVYIYGDPAQAAKTLVEFQKNNELFKVTGGVMDAKALSANELKMISDLPSKEVLLGQIVGLLVAPHRQLLGILNAVPRNVVQVINAIKEKKA